MNIYRMKNNRAGFTLIELLLAMTIFSAVLMVSTVAFIGINRTFMRAQIRKELSEASQLLRERVAKTVRAQSQTATAQSCNDVGDGVAGSFDASLSRVVGSTSYLIKSGTDGGGVWLGDSSCKNPGEQVLDEKYKVRQFEVSPVNGSEDLYRIFGVVTAGDDDAFVMPDTSKSQTWYQESRCKGTAESASVQTCAIEKFNYIISARQQPTESGLGGTP